MSAFIYNTFLLFAEGGGEGGFLKFYDDYLNIPGFEAWKFLNLAIFVGILIYILNKPLTEAFKAKRDAIRAELIKAEEEKKAALAKLTTAEGKLANLDAEKESILKRAREEADAEKMRIKEQTETDAQRLREQADAEIARLSNQTRAELRRYSAEESIRIATEKIKSQIDGNKDSRLIKAGIQEIGGLN